MSITYSQSGHLHQEVEARQPGSSIAIRRVPAAAAQPCAVVIEPRQLIRDCLAKALKATLGLEVIAFADIDEWLRICERTAASVLLLSGFDHLGGEDVSETIQRLSQAKSRVPAVVLSDAEEIGDVINALNKGIKGYIPTNLSLDIAVEAIRLIRAGGVFVPAGCLKSGRDPGAARTPQSSWSHMFTARQTAVIEALRQGKANKTIAYELSLQESTVKVHVRNIMKKLKARNRTEVAYIVAKLQKQKPS